MKNPSHAVQTLRLAVRQSIVTCASRGTRITVCSGCAWLTVERDARDFVLTAGRVFTCDADDVLVVVEMLTSGSLTISPAGAHTATSVPRWRSLANRLRGALWLAPRTTCQF